MSFGFGLTFSHVWYNFKGEGGFVENAGTRVFRGYFKAVDGWLVICLGVFLRSGLEAQSPSILYLTWTRDPTTTMTVQWHSHQKETASLIFYQREGDLVWLQQGGIYGQLEDSSLLVHSVELDGLDPDTLYRFKISGKGETVYSFRTLPSDLS